MIISLVLILVLAAGVAGITRFAQRRSSTPPPARPATAPTRRRAWVDAGLLTADQADAIEAYERGLAAAAPVRPAPGTPTTGRARRVPAVAEALGYIGGVLAAAGLVLLLAQAWDSMTTAGRLGVSAAGAAVLTIAGIAVRPEPGDAALARLRAFLWLLASGATGVLAGVAVVDAADVTTNSTRLALVAGAVALHAGSLWRVAPTASLQQATCLAAALAAVAGVGSEAGRGDVVGFVLAPAAAAVLAAGLARRTTAPALTAAIGAVGVATSGLSIADELNGPGLLIATALALAPLAVGLVRRAGETEGPVAPERLAAGVVGLAALPLAAAPTIGWYAQEAGVATGVAVAAAGAAVVVLAVRRAVRARHVVEAAGAVVVVGGLALAGVQSVGVATLAGLAAAVALVGVGTLPERSVLSIVGAVGLLVNVPWAIAWFFPGEGRTPALVMVTGASIVGVAVLLAHQSGRLRRELGGRPRPGASPC